GDRATVRSRRHTTASGRIVTGEGVVHGTALACRRNASARVIRGAYLTRPAIAGPGVVTGTGTADRRPVTPLMIDIARGAGPSSRSPGHGAAAISVSCATPRQWCRIQARPPGVTPAIIAPPGIRAPA